MSKRNYGILSIVALTLALVVSALHPSTSSGRLDLGYAVAAVILLGVSVLALLRAVRRAAA